MRLCWMFFLAVACVTPETARDVAIADATPQGPSTSFEVTTYAEELASLDKQISLYEKRALERDDDWLSYQVQADVLQQRARLSGDLGDYLRAQDALQKAFDVAPEGSGPFLSRAHLNYTLHRLNVIEPDLQAAERAVLIDNPTRSRIRLLRANVDFQRGKLEEAGTGYQEALALHRSMAGVAAVAQLAWKTGDLAKAEEKFDEAESMYHGTTAEPRAWVHLQRGLIDLDSGRYDQALEHYTDADEKLPGYWLIQEHMAEIYVLQGRQDEAIAIYRQVIADTGQPEFMDALAGVLLERGEQEEAAQWIAKAKALYLQKRAQIPEAMAGHALDHFLEFGDDPSVAVEIAEENAQLRPNGEAMTKLAAAYLKAGKIEEAADVIERTLQTPWKTAELHVTASEVFFAQNDQARAKSQRALALAINPRAVEDP